MRLKNSSPMPTFSSRVNTHELRVVQYVPTLFFGGAERVATDIAMELRARGATVVVASDISAPEDFVPMLVRAGVPLDHVPYARRRPRALRLLRSVPALAGVIRRHEPQIVHAHNPEAGTVAAIARVVARRPRVAIVTTYHGVRPHRRRLAARV